MMQTRKKLELLVFFFLKMNLNNLSGFQLKTD